MIIDTKGFEIYEDILCAVKYYTMPYAPTKSGILSFMVTKDVIYARTLVGTLPLEQIFKVDDEIKCQLACDRLNGVSHD